LSHEGRLTRSRLELLEHGFGPEEEGAGLSHAEFCATGLALFCQVVLAILQFQVAFSEEVFEEFRGLDLAVLGNLGGGQLFVDLFGVTKVKCLRAPLISSSK